MLLCGKLDERFVPLMQIISYWAKNARLVGGPSRFKTYAVFLMVVYFLQTRNPSILPSIEMMFKKTGMLIQYFALFVNYSSFHNSIYNAFMM